MAAPRYPARLMRARKFSRLSLHRKSIGFALRATSGTSTAANSFRCRDNQHPFLRHPFRQHGIVQPA